jgi:hypothetical protein
MTICVDPISSPAAWLAYVEDLKKDYEKVLFHDYENIEEKDPIQYLTMLENLLERPASKKFVGLTISWDPLENPSPNQMRATIDFMLASASRFCRVNGRPAQLRDLPQLRGAHLNTGHPHLHVALCLVHPADRSPVTLNSGWEVKLFQYVGRRAEEALGWKKDAEAPDYVLSRGKMTRVQGQEESFRLTAAERRMEWLHGECAKRRLRRQLRDKDPKKLFRNWHAFSEQLRQWETAYFEEGSRNRWVFEHNREIIAAREIGPEWEAQSLEARWGARPVSGQLGMGSVEQSRLQTQRHRIDTRLSPSILRSMDEWKSEDVEKELRAFRKSLRADSYRMITEDCERNRERRPDQLGASFPESGQATELRNATFDGKTVSLIPEKRGCLTLPLAGLSWPAKEALATAGYAPAAIFEVADGNYTALFWATSFGDPAKEYNAGRHWLRSMEEKYHTSTTSYPMAPVPCPGLHQTAQHGQKCLAMAVTGKVCKKTTHQLQEALREFDMEEARWREGCLRDAAERLNSPGLNLNPEVEIYRAHVNDLRRTSKTRCHWASDLDLRIAVRLMVAGEPAERVESILEETASVLCHQKRGDKFGRYLDDIMDSATVIARGYGDDSSSDSKAWQNTTHLAVVNVVAEEDELEEKSRPGQRRQKDDQQLEQKQPEQPEFVKENPGLEPSQGQPERSR